VNEEKTPSIDGIGLILEVATEIGIDHLHEGFVTLRFKIGAADRTQTIHIANWKWQRVKQRYSRFMENIQADN
jgi:hypothetical protein